YKSVTLQALESGLLSSSWVLCTTGGVAPPQRTVCRASPGRLFQTRWSAGGLAGPRPHVGDFCAVRLPDDLRGHAADDRAVLPVAVRAARRVSGCRPVGRRRPLGPR